MIACEIFKKNVKHEGMTAHIKSTGRIIYVIAAFEAYEQSRKMHEPAIRQMSYLYELYKQCKKWLETKKAVTSEKGQSRWMHVNTLKHQILEEMPVLFPDIFQALDAFETNKARGIAGQTRPAQGVYAHEVATYRLNKTQGAGWTPATPRYTPSATFMHVKFNEVKVRGTDQFKALKKTSIFPVRTKITFSELSAKQFRELDRVLAGQFNVLYLSKIQRLQYMVMIENGLMKRLDGTRITLKAGETVAHEMGSSAYVFDKYGNLFLTMDDDHPNNDNQRINHTTLCAGNEVLCAGGMSVKDGNLLMISNNSGHYQPTTQHLRQAVRMLRDAGIDMKTVLVNDASREFKTYTALDFLNGLEREVPSKIEKPYFQRTR